MMTVQAMSWALKQRNITGLATWVLVALAERSGGDEHHDRCRATIKSLMDVTCLPKESVLEQLQALERNGYIQHCDYNYWLMFSRPEALWRED
jgi:hypothetical protein